MSPRRTWPPLALAALVAAALVPGTSHADPPDAPVVLEDHAELLAFNSNISIGSCSGGQDSIVVSPSMSSRQYRGDFVGELYGYDFFGTWCTGYVPPTPQYCVRVPDGGGNFVFEITDAGGVDTIMALSADNPLDYLYCDDDGAGYALLSRIDTWLDGGEYLLYIGSYSQNNSGTFTLEVSSYSW